jgi:hypothetical protein
VPRKLRQLRADLARSDYVLDTKHGKGSHTWWVHPKIPGSPINLADKDGADAKPYQERDVADALRRAQGAN